jgi:hypothetical protein
MGHRDDAKMDELKKLLRRLDGLDADRSLSKAGQAPAVDQRGYVGALRGAPVQDDERRDPRLTADLALQAQFPPPGYRQAGGGAAVYVAAATAAIVSTVLVFLLLSWQRGDVDRRYMPEPASGTPGKINLQQPASGGGAADKRVADMAEGLVRRADVLIGNGDVESARVLLQKAAELGSGRAALKLGRSYDPGAGKPLNFADSQSNPALAKAWYERALVLGSQEAAEYLGPSQGK